MPTFFLIDSDGKIIWQEVGYEDAVKPELESQIGRALKTIKPE